MKKLIFFIVSIFLTVAAFAETGPVGKGNPLTILRKGTGVQVIRRAATSSVREAGTRTVAGESARRIAAGQTPKTKRKKTSVASTHTPPSGSVAAAIAHSSAAQPRPERTDSDPIAQLLHEHEELVARQQTINTFGFGGGFGKSVLLAPVTQRNDITGELEPGGFSVTVVEVQGEIFGVIATHSLSDDFFSAQFGLQKDFTVNILQPDGTPLTAQAHVVLPAPRSMLDITLVKFDPQIEPFLKPLQISTDPIDPSEILFSYGFAHTEEVLPLERPVEQISFLSVKTARINFPGGLKGHCGSPLTDAQGRVKAIHTGSGRYGTHAHFINKLVQAYHNGGKASYDLVLDGHVLTTLYVDEYISGFAVLDDNFQVLFKDDGLGTKFDEKQWKKYSEREIRNAMKKYSPNAAYLVLHSRTPFWEEKEGVAFLTEDRTISANLESNLRVHVYDIKNREFLYSIEPEDVNADNLYFELDGITIGR